MGNYKSLLEYDLNELIKKGPENFLIDFWLKELEIDRKYSKLISRLIKNSPKQKFNLNKKLENKQIEKLKERLLSIVNAFKNNAPYEEKQLQRKISFYLKTNKLSINKLNADKLDFLLYIITKTLTPKIDKVDKIYNINYIIDNKKENSNQKYKRNQIFEYIKQKVYKAVKIHKNENEANKSNLLLDLCLKKTLNSNPLFTSEVELEVDYISHSSIGPKTTVNIEFISIFFINFIF
ncbi:MAG: hypothetical protein KatS3mg090_0108 [Patescibacteria group bacterium]|nr:MAG: hypothetical protein KatS3mg090_0108 [Patescibacteria group bacterium]